MSKKTMLSLAVIGFIVIISAWAFSSSLKISRQIKSSQVNVDKNKDEAVIEKPFITETRNGNKFLEVYADSGTYDSTKNGTLLTNVKGNFYKESKVALSFESPKGIYYQKSKEVKLIGGSKAVTTDDISVIANEMHWISKKNQIIATGNVKINKSQQYETQSDGAIFYIKDAVIRNFKIMGKAQTNVFTLKPSKQSHKKSHKVTI